MLQAQPRSPKQPALSPEPLQRARSRRPSTGGSLPSASAGAAGASGGCVYPPAGLTKMLISRAGRAVSPFPGAGVLCQAPHSNTQLLPHLLGPPVSLGGAQDRCPSPLLFGGTLPQPLCWPQLGGSQASLWGDPLPVEQASKTRENF